MQPPRNPLCITCKKNYKRTRGKNSIYYYSYCADCHKERNEKWYENNPEALRLNREKSKEINRARTKAPRKKRKPRNLEQRLFFAEVLATSGDYNKCILWPFKIEKTGYGYFYIGPSRSTLVHRLILEEKLKTILPKTLDASHLCHNRSCINPHHLIAEPHEDNIKRSHRDARAFW